MKVYQRLAELIRLDANPNYNGPTLIEFVKENLPSGSGLDSGVKVLTDLESLKKSQKIILEANWHHMDEHGGYNGLTYHKVTIYPELEHGFRIKISGKNKNGVKDYMEDLFYRFLNKNYVDPTLVGDFKQEIYGFANPTN